MAYASGPRVSYYSACDFYIMTGTRQDTGALLIIGFSIGEYNGGFSNLIHTRTPSNPPKGKEKKKRLVNRVQYMITGSAIRVLVNTDKWIF